MEIIRVKKQLEDGSFDVQLKLSEEQVTYLVSFAVGQLLQAGILQYITVDEDGNPIEEELSEGMMETHLNNKTLN